MCPFWSDHRERVLRDNLRWDTCDRSLVEKYFLIYFPISMPSLETKTICSIDLYIVKSWGEDTAPVCTLGRK